MKYDIYKIVFLCIHSEASLYACAYISSTCCTPNSRKHVHKNVAKSSIPCILWTLQ